LCAAFFDRPAYPAPRGTFRPAFTDDAAPDQIAVYRNGSPIVWSVFCDDVVIGFRTRTAAA